MEGAGRWENDEDVPPSSDDWTHSEYVTSVVFTPRSHEDSRESTTAPGVLIYVLHSSPQLVAHIGSLPGDAMKPESHQHLLTGLRNGG